MAKDKLIVVESPSGSFECYRIQWKIADEEEFDGMGATLGESFEIPDNPPKDPEEFDYWIAEKTCKDLDIEKDRDGFYWESRSAAVKALKIIKKVTKSKRSIPDWAVKGLEHGWKPPKGWKA